MDDQANRPHRKTKEKKKHTDGNCSGFLVARNTLTAFIGSNPKAFAFANPGRLQKQAARSHDVYSALRACLWFC